MNKHPKTSHLTPWKPGQSGNPLGRPQGARAKFSEKACADALADWTSNGAATLERVRATDPSTYLRVLFSIIPKDIAVSIENRTGPMDGAEMQMMRRLVAMIQATADAVDPETVFGWIEEDLRARVARQIGDETTPSGSKPVANRNVDEANSFHRLNISND